MKKTILIISCSILAIVAGVFLLFSRKMEAPIVQSSNETLPISSTITAPRGKIFVRVADDAKERELGLSYFSTLPENQGMLFLFEQSGDYPFWMKEMNFPLDIIWLKKVSENSFEVVHVAENVDPATYPNSIDPKREADAVLEVNAGHGTVLGIAEGVVVGVGK